MNNTNFIERATEFFLSKSMGEIVELHPAGPSQHFIKFKPLTTFWFQLTSTPIQIEFVDMEEGTISGFINNASCFPTD